MSSWVWTLVLSTDTLFSIHWFNFFFLPFLWEVIFLEFFWLFTVNAPIVSFWRVMKIIIKKFLINLKYNFKKFQLRKFLNFEKCYAFKLIIIEYFFIYFFYLSIILKLDISLGSTRTVIGTIKGTWTINGKFELLKFSEHVFLTKPVTISFFLVQILKKYIYLWNLKWILKCKIYSIIK